MPSLRDYITLTYLIFLLSACGDIDDRPAQWSYIWPTIIEPGCTTIRCHSTFTSQAALQLDSLEGAYHALTGIPCEHPIEENKTRWFVDPGHPDRSALMYLLRGQGVPRQMPPDSPLPDADIALIETWIQDGAKCD